MLRRLLILSGFILSPAILFAGGMPNSNSESESSVNNVSSSTDTQNQPSSTSSTTTSSNQSSILLKLIIQTHKQHKTHQAVILTILRLLPMDFLQLKMNH